MQMTANEIVKSYREAKEKKKQIQILSELNACSTADIKQILRDNGVQFPGPEPKADKPKAALKEPKLDHTIIIPRWVNEAVEERINRLDEEIKTMKAELEEKRVELIELSEWLQRVKEV